MRKNRFRNPFNAQPDHLIYRFAETASDDGEGTGEGEFDPKAFATSTSATIAALQKDLATGKKTTSTELANIKKTLGDMTAALQALKPAATTEDTAEVEEETEEETPPKKVVKSTAKAGKTTEVENPEIAELKKNLTTLQKQLEAEKKRSDAADERSKAAEIRRLNAERDRLLIAATSDPDKGVEAISATDAADFLRGRTAYDEETDTWIFKDGDDTLSMEDGVKKFLPKYMIKAKTTKGGSGGHSTGNDNGVSLALRRQNAIAAGIAARKDNKRIPQFTKAKNDFEAAGGDVTEIIEEVRLGA